MFLSYIECADWSSEMEKCLIGSKQQLATPTGGGTYVIRTVWHEWPVTSNQSWPNRNSVEISGSIFLALYSHKNDFGFVKSN